MSDTSIHKALSVRVDSLAYPVARENAAFATPETAWIRETFSPTAAEQVTLGPEGYTRITGVFMLDVFVPVGKGWAMADAIYEAILVAFPRGGVLTADGEYVRIEKTYRSAGRVEPPWYQLPVTVEFRTDIQA